MGRILSHSGSIINIQSLKQGLPSFCRPNRKLSDPFLAHKHAPVWGGREKPSLQTAEKRGVTGRVTVRRTGSREKH